MDRLFVYGTLQPGGPNEHVLAAVEGEWQSGTVKGSLLEKGWGSKVGYPGLVLDKNGSEVSGHVFSADDLGSVLRDLDRFEGEEYSRVICPVTLADGGKVEAFAYVLREG